MCLGEEIGQLKFTINKGQDDGAQLKMFPDAVAINLDVRRLLMKDRIVSNLDDTLVITIKRDVRSDGDNPCQLIASKAKQPQQ